MKKRMSLVLALTAVVGIAGKAEAALWNINLGYTNPTWTGEGLSPESTASDVWVRKTAKTVTDTDIESTNATLNEPAYLSYNASGNNGTTYAAKLTGYVTGLSQFDFQFTGSSPDAFEVYLYTTGGSVTLNAGTDASIVSSRTLATNFTDGTGTYTVTRYNVYTTDPGILRLSTSSTDGTGRINAVQVRSVVPEPSTLMLLGIGGLIGSYGVKRKYALVQS